MHEFERWNQLYWTHIEVKNLVSMGEYPSLHLIEQVAVTHGLKDIPLEDAQYIHENSGWRFN